MSFIHIHCLYIYIEALSSANLTWDKCYVLAICLTYRSSHSAIFFTVEDRPSSHAAGGLTEWACNVTSPTTSSGRSQEETRETIQRKHLGTIKTVEWYKTTQNIRKLLKWKPRNHQPQALLRKSLWYLETQGTKNLTKKFICQRSLFRKLTTKRHPTALRGKRIGDQTTNSFLVVGAHESHHGAHESHHDCKKSRDRAEILLQRAESTTGWQKMAKLPNLFQKTKGKHVFGVGCITHQC